MGFLNSACRSIKYIFGVIGCIGGICSIISIIPIYYAYKAEIDKRIDLIIWHHFWVYIPFAILSLAVLINLFYRFLERKGGLAGRISIKSFFSVLFSSRTLLLENLHRKFEHTFLQTIEHIKGMPLKADKNSIDLADSVLYEKITKLLSGTTATVNDIFKADVAIHVKLFERDGCVCADGIANISESSLLAYNRQPSKKEKKDCDDSKIRGRFNKERFKVIPGWGCKKETDKKKLIEETKNFSYNTAYNYVFGTKRHYWVCNNLLKAKESGYFDSTSENWQLYYNSLAIFLITNELEPGGEVPEEGVYGILVIDSHESGIFNEQLIRQIGGYFAHRFYEVFKTIHERSIQLNRERMEKKSETSL